MLEHVALAGAMGVNAVLGYSLLSAILRRGAPFVPTAQRKVDALFAVGGILHPGSPLLKGRGQTKRMRVVDLGSGDGVLVRAATRQAGERVREQVSKCVK